MKRTRPGARVRLPRAEIIAAYRAGHSCGSIARLYDVAEETVRRRLIEWGVRMRRPGQQQGRVRSVRRIATVGRCLIDDVDVTRDEDGFRAVALSGGAVVARTPPQGSHGAAVAEAVERWGV